MSQQSPGPRRYVMPTTPGAARMLRGLNATVAWLTGRGLSVAGSRILAVRGRSSGQWRTTPVNPLVVGGVRYLVAPRGHTQWVRNLRVAGAGELRVGRRVEAFIAEEVADEVKAPVLREYVRRWKWEVGQFFEDLGPDSTDAELLAAAPGFPVFRVLQAEPGADRTSEPGAEPTADPR